MWWSKYIGIPWEPSRDCFWWFREWRKIHFDSIIPDIGNNDRHCIRNSCSLMSDKNGYEMGWNKTDSPIEGDAVTMSFNKLPHHIGMAVMVSGRIHVLHAMEGSSIMVSGSAGLKSNGLKIIGYWTPCK